MSTTQLRTQAVLRTGAAGAAILSATLGCSILGLLTDLGDGSKTMARWLTFCKPTGPLAGVTTLSIVLWLMAWLFLHRRWRETDCAFGKVSLAAGLLLVLAFLLTFPPFENLLLGK